MDRTSGGFKVPIVAPTLGLITRVSPNEPDVRAATVASNVRFEKGVARNAYGFATAALSIPLDSPANLIFQTSFYDPATNTGIIGTARKIYSLTVPADPLSLALFQIYDFGSNVADARNRIIAASFFNKVLFAQPDSPLLSWEGSGAVTLAIGLDPSSRWNGVNTFKGYVVIWSQSLFKWSAVDDATDWIPVGVTATSALLVTTEPFTIPDVGETSGWIYVDSATAALLAIGQFMSITTATTVTYFNVAAVLPATGMTGQVAGFSQSVAVGAQQPVFINTFVPYVAGAQLQFTNNSAILQVVQDAVDPGTYVTAVAANFNVPAVGSQVTVSTAAAPQYTPGTYVSVGVQPSPGSDIYLVNSVDLINNLIILTRVGVGFTNATLHQAGEFIVPQPSVLVTNISNVEATGNFQTPLKELYAFEATVTSLTGAQAAGTVVPVGTQIFSVDANGAGESFNAGVEVNGPILWFDKLGDVGYIFKNRSIQSVQYVGIDQGTFDIRAEITDEGFIGRYSFAKVGEDILYIFGNREIYKYTGFKSLIPVGRQHAVQVLAELDRGRTDEIVGYHNELDFEIWFAYPVVGTDPDDAPYRVFIYNYVEDSCTVDDYDPSVHAALVLHGITAVGRLDLSAATPWIQALGTWIAPLSWPADATWQDLTSDSPQNRTVGAFQYNEAVGGPTLALLNTNFDRDGIAMLCQYETPDFTAGDDLVWKYHNTCMLSFQAVGLVKQNNPYVAKIQIGSRNNLVDDIVWSNPVNLSVDPQGRAITKVDIKRSGRYLRVRINSNQAGCGWRIASMTPLGRLGSGY